MQTRISEIADGIYRLSTYVPDIAPPAGFTFNQFLVLGDEPLMFHTGLRKMFGLNRGAVSRIIPPERLRWIAYGHFEADECGALNEWLAIAPQAQAAHGQTGCMVSLNDFSDRPPRVLSDGETIDLGGGKRVRFIDTPHTPHGWDAGVLYEQSTKTCCAGTCSPSSEMVRRSLKATSSNRRSRRRTCSSIPLSIPAWARPSAGLRAWRRARWR